MTIRINSMRASFALSAFAVFLLSEPVADADVRSQSALTVQQIMDNEVDPSADTIWGAVGIIEGKSGAHLRQPRNAAGWRELADAVDRLIDGAGSLSHTTNVGENGHGLLADASTPGIRTAAQITQDIHNDPKRFAAAALRLRDAGLAAKTAIAARDAQGILKAGAQMDAACEACHSAYWYPRTPPLALPPDSAFAKFPEQHAAGAPRPATPD
jgi:hypothetical protein